MVGVKFTLYKTHRILLLDLRGLEDVNEGIEAFERCEEIIMNYHKKTIILLTDVTNAHYNMKAANVMKSFSKTITPYIIASAAVGVTGIKKVILQSLTRLSGREIKIFENQKDAMNWLVDQAENYKREIFKE